MLSIENLNSAMREMLDREMLTKIITLDDGVRYIDGSVFDELHRNVIENFLGDSHDYHWLSLIHENWDELNDTYYGIASPCSPSNGKSPLYDLVTEILVDYTNDRISGRWIEEHGVEEVS